MTSELFEHPARLKAPAPGRHVRAASQQHVSGPDVGTVSLGDDFIITVAFVSPPTTVSPPSVHLVFVAQVIRSRYEDHGVHTLAVALESAHTSTVLVSLAELSHVKQPGLARLVEGGGEDEVSGQEDPGGLKYWTS